MEKSVIREMKSLFPVVQEAYIASDMNLGVGADSLLRIVLQPVEGKALSPTDEERLIEWLKTRTETPRVAIVIDNSK